MSKKIPGFPGSGSILKSFLFLCLFLGFGSAWAKPSYWVYAYIDANTDVNGKAITFGTDIPWGDITHLVDTFAVPGANGALNTTEDFGSPLVTGAHNNATRACLSIGGAGNEGNFSSDVGTYQSAFIANIVKAVTVTGYDGIDIDWEFPAASDEANLQSFMTTLYADIKALPASTVDGLPRTLTIYIGCGDEICVSSWSNLGNACDEIILSGYDFGYDVYNGPIVDTSQTMSNSCDGLASNYADVTTLFNLVNGNGVPASKCVLGCPLYGNYPATQYNEVPIITLLTTGTPGNYEAAEMEQLYTYEGNATTANTEQSFCDKINWTLGKGMKGIGLWDTAQGCPITNSYAAPIWGTIGGTNSCVTVSSSTATLTPTPASTATSTKIPTPTASKTSTPSATPTSTRTRTFTSTVTYTPVPPTSTSTPTVSSTPTKSFTSTSTATSSMTASATASRTSSSTSTSTGTPSFTSSWTSPRTSTLTMTPTVTHTSTVVITPISTNTPLLTSTTTVTPGNTSTFTSTSTPTFSSTTTNSPSNTATGSMTATPSLTASRTSTSTATHTTTSTITNSPTPTASSTQTGTVTPTPLFSYTSTSTITRTDTPVFTHTQTDMPTNTSSPTPTDTTTSTPTAPHTFSSTFTYTPTFTLTTTFTQTFTPSHVFTFTQTPSPTATATFTASYTPTPPVIQISIGSGSPGNSTVVPGTANVPDLQFTLTNNSASPVTLTGITVPVSGGSGVTEVILETAGGTVLGTGAVSGGMASITLNQTLVVPPGTTVTYQLVLSFSNSAAGTYSVSVGPGNLSASSASGPASFTGTAVGATVTVAAPTATPSSTPTASRTPSSTSTPSAKGTPVIYPNPISGPGPVSLRVPLTAASNVEVEVFTTAFRKVNQLEFFNVQPGTVLPIPLTDKEGHPLADGLYYVMIKAQGKTWIVKLLIVR